MTTYRTGPTIRTAPDAPAMADTLADACTVVSRAADARTFACARPKGHTGTHYGQDRTGPVRLGYGAGGY